MLEYDELPTNIKDILNTFDENKCGYSECRRIQALILDAGYISEYGLDGEIYVVEKISQ